MRVAIPKHVCSPDRTCCCSVQALEPNEECPVHGYPTRIVCGVCSWFLPRTLADEIADGYALHGGDPILSPESDA